MALDLKIQISSVFKTFRVQKFTMIIGLKDGLVGKVSSQQV